MSVPLVIAGVVAFLAGVALLVTRRTGAASAALGLGALLVLGAFVFPRVAQEAEELPRVSFVQPSEGAELPAGEVTIEVRVVNGMLATSPTSSGGHLHLYIDETLVQMPYADSTTVELQAGSHALRVEYVDERHISFTPPVEDSIEVMVT